jgi:BirA family biotin operon repressor/biotin-[acetyl-CoA-carboxylase] ligase
VQLIKLDAIDSTNDFLKKMARESELADFTVVTAKTQTNGRGQMGARWYSEAGKNLITSIYIKDSVPGLSQLHLLNIAVAISVAEVLEAQSVEDLSVKWPNDIMAANKKCGGILIENNIRPNGRIDCVIGIGLNVNQQGFEDLPGATSLGVVTGKSFDIDELLTAILNSIQKNTIAIADGKERLLREYYKRLFKKDIPMSFKSSNDGIFVGIIRGIDESGSLLVELEDQSVSSFRLKEITMLY